MATAVATRSRPMLIELRKKNPAFVYGVYTDGSKIGEGNVVGLCGRALWQRRLAPGGDCAGEDRNQKQSRTNEFWHLQRVSM